MMYSYTDLLYVVRSIETADMHRLGLTSGHALSIGLKSASLYPAPRTTCVYVGGGASRGRRVGRSRGGSSVCHFKIARGPSREAIARGVANLSEGGPRALRECRLLREDERPLVVTLQHIPHDAGVKSGPRPRSAQPAHGEANVHSRADLDRVLLLLLFYVRHAT